MTLVTLIRRHGAKLAFVVGVAGSAVATALDRAQVDLSVDVSMLPATFVPGGHNVFSVTVHNAGPDDAGTIFPDEKPINVYGSTILFRPEVGTPLEIVGVLSGDCWIYRYSEVMPNGNWVVQFIYFFDPIAAGTSRTCTSDIYFSSHAAAAIATHWKVASSNDTDTNASNDNVDYTFVAAPPPAISVPAGSSIGWLMLGCVLLLVGGFSSKVWLANR